MLQERSPIRRWVKVPMSIVLLAMLVSALPVGAESPEAEGAYVAENGLQVEVTESGGVRHFEASAMAVQPAGGVR